ncbi:MAG: DNA polymerase beta superfamily protein, partial [Inhella sp.]
MIPAPVHSEILTRIERAEREHGVRVLLAVESGSRAWGFESPNSDYDARFIYANTSDWYLSVKLEDKRDVIEYPITDEIDLNGWDVRKALRLFARSNPAIVEWIQPPIVYLERGNFARGQGVRSCLKGSRGQVFPFSPPPQNCPPGGRNPGAPNAKPNGAAEQNGAHGAQR